MMSIPNEPEQSTEDDGEQSQRVVQRTLEPETQAEINAMRRLASTLEQLDEDVQHRVLVWLFDRYGPKVPE